MSLTVKNGEEPIPENLRDQAFKELRSINKNNMCIDCEKKNPKWASIHLGIYLCIDCAGKHRQYGVIYSFIKSTNLDTWNRKQITFMQKGGNSRALDYFRKCGIMSDNQKHIDYKSPIVQKYKAILTAEVEAQLSGIPQLKVQKQSYKNKGEAKEQFDKDGNEVKKLTEIPNAQLAGQQAKGKKANKKKIGKKINLQDFDTMEFDDGVPTEEKQKIIKAYEQNSIVEDKKATPLTINTDDSQKIREVQPIQEKSRELSEQETKKKLQDLKSKQNLKSISSEEFKDNSISQNAIKQTLNKFHGSTSISSDAFFNNGQSQGQGSVSKIKDFVSDTKGKIYEKLSGYWARN